MALQPQQPLRSKTKRAPRKLRNLLELVMHLPPDGAELRLLYPSALKAEAASRLEAVDSRFLNVRLAEVIVERTATLVPKLREYVYLGDKGSGEEPDDGGVVGRFHQLWIAYTRLRAIARLASGKLESDRYLVDADASLLRITDWIDSQGFVRVSKDPFAEAMEQTDVEANRIRECEICKRVFWAGRINQSCCSAKCSGAIRARRHRAKHKQDKQITKQARKTQVLDALVTGPLSRDEISNRTGLSLDATGNVIADLLAQEEVKSRLRTSERVFYLASRKTRYK